MYMRGTKMYNATSTFRMISKFSFAYPPRFMMKVNKL